MHDIARLLRKLMARNEKLKYENREYANLSQNSRREKKNHWQMKELII